VEHKISLSSLILFLGDIWLSPNNIEIHLENAEELT
jgi:hypothetical protein